jgi:RHS repeat-associated protein
LQYLKGGMVANPTSLQNLTYTYDNNGNVLTILDTVNSSQKQCYGYDALNRLTSAKVGLNDSTCSSSVGNGEYADETYTYNTSTGNLYTKTGIGTYTYNATHKHAVASTTNGWTFSYDGNGNMTTRSVGTSYTYGYDAENRLTSVSGGTNATFVYDGDGVRVKGTAGGVTTAYVGNYFEWTGSTSTMNSYYYAGSTRVAMRTGSNTPLWLLGDHLGSTSRVANYDGSAYTNGWQLYKAWGEKRYPSGASGLPTTYRYTGQRQESSLGGADGLYYYGARWYDPALGRFTQPDTIIPESSQGTQAWDRLAYVNNNPVNYNDPTGQCAGPGGECPEPEATPEPESQVDNEEGTPTPEVTPQPPVPIPTPPYPPVTTPTPIDYEVEWVITSKTYYYSGDWDEGRGLQNFGKDINPLSYVSGGKPILPLEFTFQTRYVGIEITYTRVETTTILGTDGKVYTQSISGEQRTETDVYIQSRTLFNGYEIVREQTNFGGGSDDPYAPDLYYDP